MLLDLLAVCMHNVCIREGKTTDKDGLYHGMAGYKNHIKKNEAQVCSLSNPCRARLSRPWCHKLMTLRAHISDSPTTISRDIKSFPILTPLANEYHPLLPTSLKMPQKRVDLPLNPSRCFILFLGRSGPTSIRVHRGRSVLPRSYEPRVALITNRIYARITKRWV